MKLDPAAQRYALIGLGLIGGSVALAIRRDNPQAVIIGYDASDAAAQMAQELHMVNRVAALLDVVREADVLILAAPIAAFGAIFDVVDANLKSSAVVFDVASTKQTVLDLARGKLQRVLPRFVPCHPIAGSEASGAAAARPDLFDDKPVILTAVRETDQTVLARVTDIWHTLGAKPVSMAADEHDQLFAYLSHAPHLLAYLWMNQAAALADPEKGLQLAGPGFRDFTRIAASDPALWTGILMDNRAAIAQWLRAHVASVESVLSSLDGERSDQLLQTLKQAASLRRALA